MENKMKQGYLFAFIIGLLTVLVCMVVADGLIGIEGTIHDYIEYEDGHHEFALKVSDPTGRIISGSDCFAFRYCLPGRLK